MTQYERYRFKEEQFTTDLDELFDVPRKDAADVIVNKEDKVFLEIPQEDPSNSSMSGVDKTMMNLETRKWKRDAEAIAQKENGHCTQCTVQHPVWCN